MMIRDFYPDLEREDELGFIEKIPMKSVFPIISEITAYFDKNMTIAGVYDHYGISIRGVSGGEYQIPCLLLEHGSQDTHNSARYYASDRETGVDSERIWCFKCQKFLTPFWLFHSREKDYHGLSFREILQGIWKYFRIPFPRELVLDFDPEKFYQFEDSKIDEKLKILKQAQKIMVLKEFLPREYLVELKRFWKSAYTG